MRIVQLCSPSGDTRVAMVEGDKLRLLDGNESVYALAQAALREFRPLAQTISDCASEQTLDYDQLYRLESEWRLLPPLTHPDPSRCVVSGPGLTHRGGGENRHARNAGQVDPAVRVRMYRP